MSVDTDLMASTWAWLGIFLYVLCLAAAWVIYVRSRPLMFSLISDAFCLFFFALWGPVMFIFAFLSFPAGAQPAYGGLADPYIVFWSFGLLSIGIFSVAVGFGSAEIISGSWQDVGESRNAQA